MTFEYSAKVKGLNHVQQMLANADAQKSFKVGFQWGMQELIQEMEYPPPSEANYPHTKVYTDPRTGRSSTRITWYKRGTGQKYQTRGGAIRTYKTSEDLRRSWTKKLYTEHGEIRGKVANTASYSPWVVGEEQPHYHKKRGWERLKEKGEDVAKKITDKIIRHFKQTLGG